VRHTERQYDSWDEPGGLPAAGNVLPVVLGLVGIGVVVCAVWVFGPQADRWTGEKLESCLLITDDHARLACYDEIATPHQPAKGALVPAQAFHEGSQ